MTKILQKNRKKCKFLQFLLIFIIFVFPEDSVYNLNKKIPKLDIFPSDHDGILIDLEKEGEEESMEEESEEEGEEESEEEKGEEEESEEESREEERKD